MNWKGSLTASGVGAFLGFFLALLVYLPLENELFAYGILIGAIGGAVVGVRVERDFNSSPVSFLLGLLVTILLGVLFGAGWRGDVRVILLLITVVTLLVRPSGLVDALLSPVTYTGGFALSLLALRFYGPVQNVESGIPSIVIFSGSAIALVFFSALARWGVEKFRAVGKDNA